MIISNLKWKIIAVIIIASLISTSLYYFYTTPKEIDIKNEKQAYNMTNLTALEAINLTLDHMSSKYDSFNISKIWLPFYAWEITYVINEDDKVIYEKIFVLDNGTIYNRTSTYETAEMLSWYYPQDTRGVDVESIFIDSDQAKDIINNAAGFGPPLSVRFECSLVAASKPMWVGYYTEYNYRISIKVNATNGEIIECDETYKKPINLFGNSTFDGQNFTAFDGLEYISDYMEVNYPRAKIFKASPGIDNTGFSLVNYWKYTYTVLDDTNIVVHMTSHVYENGTVTWKIELLKEMWQVPQFAGIINVHGIDDDLLIIDSDDAIDIVINNITNDTWDDTSSYSIILEQSDYSKEAMWHIRFADYFYRIDVTTGEII